MLDVFAHRMRPPPIIISFWLLLSSSFAAAQDKSDSAENLLIENECRQLGVMYSHFVDLNQAEKVAGLFSESGTFSMNGVDVVGREAINALFVSLQNKKDFTSKHLVSNELITRKSETLLEGRSYVAVYYYPNKAFSNNQDSEDYLVATAQYEDQYILSEKRCFIEHRKVIPVFVRQ